VTEHVIQGVVKSAVVEEVAAMRAQATRGGATGYPPVKKLHSTKKLRVLITGGAGFVGSNLVDKLMREGHEVTVLDNLFTGRKKKTSSTGWATPTSI
jgi:FlaA1/EpsC-like NDP-sugar epimerase